MELKINAIGASGSGKTLFLASLYRALHLKPPNSCFYLATDPVTSNRLQSTYMQVADTGRDWPEATSMMTEWVLTTCVSTKEGQVEPLRFRYLDYPGGVLTNPRALESTDGQLMASRLRSADALLILLDGQSILALLRGEPRGDRFIDFELTATLEIVQQTRCPVHFVVTKWDLLQAAGISLGQVRRRLAEDDSFRDCLTSRVADTASPIRLIPASAVGQGFATLDPDGTMRKIPGARARPWNAELPLLAVLPDLAHQAFRSESENVLLAVRQRELAAAAKPSSGGLTAFWQAVKEAATVLKLSPAGIRLLRYLDAIWGIERDPVKRQSALDEDDALAMMIREFRERLARLEQEEPSSLLTSSISAMDARLLAARGQIADEAARPGAGSQ